MKEWAKTHAKAIAAGATAGLTVLLASLPDGVTAEEWWSVLAAVLLPFGVTWRVPNKPQAE